MHHTPGPEHYEGQDLEALSDMPHYYAWILQTLGPYLRGRVLEVGAGTGNFASCWVDGATEALAASSTHISATTR